MDMTWWTALDLSAKAEFIMLGVVFGAFIGTLLFMAITSLIEVFKNASLQAASKREHAPRIVRKSPILSGLVSFFNWYFKILGI
jgi:hypothetical protein